MPEPLSFSRASHSWMYTIDPEYALLLSAPRPKMVEEVMIGQYTENNGLTELGEFAVRWYELGHHGHDPAPRLEIYSDSWGAFDHPQMQALVAWMTENATSSGRRERATPDALCARLLELGFVDITPREAPPESERWGQHRKAALRIQALPDSERVDAITRLLMKLEPKAADGGVP